MTRLVALLIVVGAAAPAAAQTTVPDPPPGVDLRPVNVRFRGNVEGLRVRYLADPVLDEGTDGLVVRRVAPTRYEQLCVAPCDRDLPQTHVGLAVEREGHLVRFEAPLGVDGPTGVTLTWEDNSGLRLAGILTLAIGSALGVGLAVPSLVVGLDDPVVLGAGLGIASALIVGSVVVGVLLALIDDGASFEAVPLPGDASGVFSTEWR